jgi:hypothetical protein
MIVLLTFAVVIFADVVAAIIVIIVLFSVFLLLLFNIVLQQHYQQRAPHHNSHFHKRNNHYDQQPVGPSLSPTTNKTLPTTTTITPNYLIFSICWKPREVNAGIAVVSSIRFLGYDMGLFRVLFLMSLATVSCYFGIPTRVCCICCSFGAMTWVC